MRPVVLLAEEQPLLRQRYAEYLRGQGYDVLEAADHVSVVEMARKHRPSSIVLDPDIGEGQGRRAVLALLDLGLNADIIFNTSRPCCIEDDFSSWIADAYVVRTTDVSSWGRALARHLPSSAQTARANHFEAAPQGV